MESRHRFVITSYLPTLHKVKLQTLPVYSTKYRTKHPRQPAAASIQLTSRHPRSNQHQHQYTLASIYILHPIHSCNSFPHDCILYVTSSSCILHPIHTRLKPQPFKPTHPPTHSLPHIHTYIHFLPPFTNIIAFIIFIIPHPQTPQTPPLHQQTTSLSRYVSLPFPCD